MRACVARLLGHSSIPIDEICGFGAGVPGKVDRKQGIAVYQNNLPWRNFHFKDRMREAFGVDTVVIDNDVYMAAFAEWQASGIDAEDLFVYLTISTGISSAIIQGGEFIRGAGFAGEIGLVPVRTANPEQPAERLEWQASGPAIERRARELLKNERVTTEEVFQMFYDGDKQAAQVMEEALEALAHGIYMMASVLDPNKLVFGGSVAVKNPLLLDLIKAKMKNYLIAEQQHVLGNMEIGRLGNDQGIIGAGLRALTFE
ncbi:ROK family protein [Virgibacillus halophilus]|uniref:ROK family protein n=1 Tax=Tigheibacillus halophilus TaxID=361280 RepID=A0ABU5C484_9BACI|nr:ROK family protein [Virgibacillus halophilus]